MVCILLGNGFEEAEALVPADLLRRAGADVVLTSLEGDQAVGSHHITVKTDKNLSEIDPKSVELVMLPGGLGGVKALGEEPGVAALVRAVLDQGGYAAAICAAPTLLASLGLLDGTKAVCYPGMENEMAGAIIQPSVPFTVDGHIITGKAAGAVFPFGLKLVELLQGAEAVQRVKDAVHYHG